MKSSYELKEKSTAELLVTVDGQLWSDALAKAYRKLASTVELKGFRKGKAPENRVRALLGKQIHYEAVELVAQKALEFGLDENKNIELEDRPSLDIVSVEDDCAVLKFELVVKPTVTLGNYQEVKYQLTKHEVSEEEVDKEISLLQSQHAEEVVKEEGTVEMGNIAVIDFEGFVDGVAFEGGKATEYPLEIGSHSFIEGFEEQIVSMAIDEEKDINVTFPENYTAELAGKPAVFHVKVDGIKEKQLPEVNEEFISELKMGDEVKTVEDLRTKLKTDLQAEADRKAEAEANDNFLDALCDVCTVEIPQAMIDRKNDETYQQHSYSISANGFDMKSYLQMMGMTESEYKSQLSPQSEKTIKIRLILEAIGKDMALEVTDEELQAEYQSIADMYKMDIEKVKQVLSDDMVKDDVLVEKTLDTLKGTKAQ
ncbi:MAG: trigger factor [Erysipelotrichaceae bacterium]